MTDIFDEDDEDTFREAIETWGIVAQADMAIEECGELIVELSHWKRGRDNREEVIEELVDIRIMSEQLRWYLGPDFVDPEIEPAMDQLRERLDEADSPGGLGGR